MTCPYHGNYCAYPEPDPAICPVCHASWSKITAPATRTTTREAVFGWESDQETGKRRRVKNGPTLTVTDVAYLDGYGEMPLNHLWRHAESLAAAEAAAVRRSRSRKPAA